MTESPSAPAVPRPAATLLLVRDGPNGLEVLMARRHQQSSFMPGLLVFPGGRVDAGDGDAGLRDALPPDLRALPDLVSRIGAIREAFEELGILLARPAGTQALIDRERLAQIAEAHRQRIHAARDGFAAMIADETLTLAPDCLIPFAHWITPPISPKRFDTRFYVALAPEGQDGIHDTHELVSTDWVAPLDALAQAEAGDVRIAFVTRSNLKLLSRSRTVAEALQAAKERKIVTVEPQPFDLPDGPALRIPADAGYDILEVLVRDTGIGG